MTAVKYTDLEFAVEFVSGGDIMDAQAYISRNSGEIYFVSDDSDLDEAEVPDDVGDPELYAEVPAKRDLNLGKRLVLKFAAGELPDRYEEIDAIFRRRGAYSRFKELLAEADKLDAWYEYESSAMEAAIFDWAESEGLTVEKD